MTTNVINNPYYLYHLLEKLSFRINEVANDSDVTHLINQIEPYCQYDKELNKMYQQLIFNIHGTHNIQPLIGQIQIYLIMNC